MRKSTSVLSDKAGLPPGTLIHVGKKRTEQVKISVLDYSSDGLEETICEQVDECFSFKDSDTMSWINVDGLDDVKTISAIGKHFKLHPLLQEDLLNTRHRPSVEDYGDCLYFSLKMLGVSVDGKSIVTEHVSFVLGNNWLLSFQEVEGDIFDALRNRLRENKGAVRKLGADYLLYRLIDTVVDNYFLVTEHISGINEDLEEKVLRNSDTETLQEIQQQKRMLVDFRKSIGPLREAVGTLQKENLTLIKDGTIRYLRDVYEHIIQVNESIDTQREMVANIMDLYLSGVSNKMNQVMQLLTIISTIFIPLTFIAGIYGMNFDHMPELHWKNGYLGVWGLMLIVLVGMIIFFKRKKWL